MNDNTFDTGQLVTFALFKDVDLEFIEHLLAQCAILELEAGETLTVGAEEVITFFVILGGELHNHKGDIFTPGKTVGDENLFYADRHSYVLEAAEPTRLLVLPEDDFWRMVSLDQNLVRNLTHGRLRHEHPIHLSKAVRHWLLIGAALILASTLATVAYEMLSVDSDVPIAPEEITFDPDDEEKDYTVTTRAVDDWVQITGTVQPIRWTEVSAAISSRITDVKFTFGDSVTNGQPLLDLADEEQQRRRREAESAVIRAEQEAHELSEWESGLEVRRAQRDLLRSTEERELAEAEVENAQRLFDRGIISSQEFESTKNQAEHKRIEEINARESLDATLAKGDETALHLAELQLANARQELAAIEQDLAGAHITSPVAGVIFPVQSDSKGEDNSSTAPLTLGAPVQVHESLFAIADMQGIALEADVAEIDMLSLAKGQPARVQFDALPGLELEGHIESVAGRGTSREYRGTVFRVRVVVPQITEEQRNLLRIGMSARALVLTYHNAEAIVIPFEAVTLENGQYVVHKWVNSQWQVVPVQIRSTLVDGIEVSDGLMPGDHVLLPTHSTHVP